MHEQARVLRGHIPCLYNFGLFNELLELGDAAEHAEREGQRK